MPFESQFYNPPEEEKAFQNGGFSGGEFLRKKYPDKFKELGRITDADPTYSLIKKSGKDSPHSWIDDWLKKVDEFHKRHRDDQEAMKLIRGAFHAEYVIKPDDIPEGYFENQQRLARERGHGDVEITDEVRKQNVEIIVSDQKSTLDNWVDYIFSPDADIYPMWAKYWAISSVSKLSSYDKEKKCFGKRRKDTVAPFPDLNREALAYVVDIVVKKARRENIENLENNNELKKLVESENFGKLYAYAIEKITPTEENELAETEGEWIKYPQASDHMPLVNSLQGHGTGWCTAGETTAEAQLQGGDFYVYYSKDKAGKYTIPRAAIRMERDNIGEIRGIGPDQNMDPYIGKIVDEKLKSFPDAEKYKKKTADMELLTAIDKKQNLGRELTKEELVFLYEIDSRIDGFGYQKDPRIEEIIEKRNVKTDLVLMMAIPLEYINIKDKEKIFISSERIRFFIKNSEKIGNDVKLLFDIAKKYDNGQELTQEELRFIYEIDNKIITFSSKEDPRIKMIKAGINLKSNLSSITGVEEEEISITEEEALSGGIKFHFGNLNLSGINIEDNKEKIPRAIIGNVTVNTDIDVKILSSICTVSGTINYFWKSDTIQEDSKDDRVLFG